MTTRMFNTEEQDRQNFTLGLGILAIADPDDWDDTGSPSSRGTFDSTLVSPAVPIPAGTSKLYLVFGRLEAIAAGAVVRSGPCGACGGSLGRSRRPGRRR